LTTGLQIQNYKKAQNFDHERNPYNHTAQDSIAHMNLDYWLEQIKASVVFAASMAGPLTIEK